MKKAVLFLVVLLFLSSAFIAVEAISFLSSPAQNEDREVIFEIPYGTAFYHVARQLEEKGLISSSLKFRILAKFLNSTTRLKVGEYKLNTNMKPRHILDMLVSGHSISYTITIPEGYNIFEIRDLLNRMWLGRGDEFFKTVTNPAFIKELTGEDLPSLEGYLFPETYSLTKYTSVETLVRRMHDYFLQNISEINKNQKVPMSLRDQVILASVIEKETGAPSERPVISSVFHNRLKKKMKLQSDPTIIYGIMVETKDFVKNITKADILRHTPYNTYTVKALPVAPIANPGRESLWAAVNPLDSEYLYFVSQNNGTHVFSENYKKHENAVKKFQLDRKMREGTSWRDLKTKNR